MPSTPEAHRQARNPGPADLLQDLAGDDHPVDLVGSLVDLGGIQGPFRPRFCCAGRTAGDRSRSTPAAWQVTSPVACAITQRRLRYSPSIGTAVRLRVTEPADQLVALLDRHAVVLDQLGALRSPGRPCRNRNRSRHRYR